MNFENYPENRIKIYKWKNNENYFKEYNKENCYYCNICNCNVAINRKQLHQTTKKHSENLERFLIIPQNIYTPMKRHQVIA